MRLHSEKDYIYVQTVSFPFVQSQYSAALVKSLLLQLGKERFIQTTEPGLGNYPIVFLISLLFHSIAINKVHFHTKEK